MVRKLLVLAALLIGAVVAFFVFHHPPMRLMPPPLMFQQGGERVFGLAPALAEGSEIAIFYGTSRLPVGPRDNRIYTVAPDRRLHLGEAELRIGDEDSTLHQLREWTTGATGGARPFINLERMNEQATLAGAAPGEAAPLDPEVTGWLAEIDALLARSRNKDILVYVHGANTTVERAAGQASQLRHFTGRDSVVVLFAWPTAENFLRYSRDIYNAFGSAPYLAQLIDLLAEHTDARNIDVFTYSAGATVGSAALTRVARDYPRAAERLGEVYHAAPDADFRGFVDDLKVYGKDALRVTTAVNLGDSALRLAAVVNRASRAGRPDLSELSPEASDWMLDAAGKGEIEIIQVRPEDMPDLAASSHTFWYDDPWVSNDVLVTLLLRLPPAERGLAAAESQSGARYWSFPPDYPERAGALIGGLAAGPTASPDR